MQLHLAAAKIDLEKVRASSFLVLFFNHLANQFPSCRMSFQDLPPGIADIPVVRKSSTRRSEYQTGTWGGAQSDETTIANATPTGPDIVEGAR